MLFWGRAEDPLKGVRFLKRAVTELKGDATGMSRPLCEDESKGALDFYEIKRDKSRISLKELERKASAFFAKNPELQGRVISFKGLSIEEM